MPTFMTQAASVVIGGADGPTAIFVAGKSFTALVLICLAAGLAAGLVAGIIYKRFKKKRDDEKL